MNIITINKRRAQSATEYIIIVGVVIVIALIMVVAMGGIPGIGDGVNPRVSHAYWESADIGIEDWAIDSSGNVNLYLKNNQPNNLVITGITLDETSIYSGSTQLDVGGKETITGSLSSNVSGNYEYGCCYNI